MEKLHMEMEKEIGQLQSSVETISKGMSMNNLEHKELTKIGNDNTILLTEIKSAVTEQMKSMASDIVDLKINSRNNVQRFEAEKEKIKEYIKEEVGNRDRKFNDVWKVVKANAEQVHEWKSYLKIILGIFGIMNVGAIILALVK